MGAIKELLKAGIKALVKEEMPMATTKVAKSGAEELEIAKASSNAINYAKGKIDLGNLIAKHDKLRSKLVKRIGTDEEYDELSKLESMITSNKEYLEGIKNKSIVPINKGSKYGVGKDVASTNTNTGKPMATKLGVDEYMGKLKQNHANSETRNKERYEEMMKSGLGK